jgi:endonuclease I
MTVILVSLIFACDRITTQTTTNTTPTESTATTTQTTLTESSSETTSEITSQTTTNTTTSQTTQTTETTTQTSTLHSTETTTETTTEVTSTTTTESVIVVTEIELVDNEKKFYRLNDEFNKDSLELWAYKSDNTSFQVSSEDIKIRSFNSSTSGKKTIFIIYDKFMIETTIYILEEYAFEINMAYYETAINLKGNNLKVTLNNIINNYTQLLYGEARYILQESDVDPNNSNNIVLVYLGTSIKKDWDGGATWNREHVWPQSRLGVGVGYGDDDFPSKATDVHNLKPADPNENATRSNDYFDYFNTNDTYEPRDEVKGDIARILFYMATMYFDLSLNDDPLSSSGLKSMGILSVLLEWNDLDPVDDFERNRNEVIFSYQGNRNPFIDYPDFADLIWGEEV